MSRMARSDSEAESVASDDTGITFSQQFEPQEDDEDLLWEVEKITQERKKEYKVKWKGIDPKTRKPWEQSWVAKKDCTPDLVIAWKEEKKELERRNSIASKARDSIASKKSGPLVVLSKASTSQLHEAFGSSAKLRRGRSSTASTRAATTVSPSALRKQSKSSVNPVRDSSPEVEEEIHVLSKAKAKGKKRKLAEANSAHNSAHLPVDVNVNKAGETVEQRPAVGRPSKKRKIEIETVKQEPIEMENLENTQSTPHSQAHTQAQPQATQDEESQEVRKVRGKSGLFLEEEEEEDEAEERMVEDALSQGYNSPTPIYDEEDQIEEVPEPTLDKGKRRAIEVDNHSEVGDLEEDSVIVISGPPKNQPKKSTTTNGVSAAKSSSKSVKSTQPSTSKTKAKSTKKSKEEVVSESAPPSPPPKFGPPSKRKSSINPKIKTSNPHQTPLPAPNPALPTSVTATVTPKRPNHPPVRPYRNVMQPSRNYPPVPSITSDTNVHADTNSYTDSESDSNSNSDSESNVHVQHLFSGSQSNQSIPIEEPSAVWQGDSEVSVLLSPADLERLRVFDQEVMNVAGPSRNPNTGTSVRKAEKMASPSKTVVQKEKDGKGQVKKGQNGRKREKEVDTDIFSSNSEYSYRPPSSPKQAAQKQQATSSADAQVTEEQANAEIIEIIVDHRVEDAQPAVRGDLKELQRPQQSKRDLNSTTPKPKSATSSTAATESKTNGTHRQRSAKPSNDRDEEVIPETEEEESQSQSQLMKMNVNLDLPTPAPPPSYPQPPSTPGSRSTARSRMKPRTPLSRASSTASVHNPGAVAVDRPLRPIPELLPSVFHPHLPQPVLSLPESIVDTSGSDQLKNRQDDEEVAMSSIEDFDTPDKSKKMHGKQAKTKPNPKQKQKESAEEIWESDTVKRGQEIAEAAKRKLEAERNEIPQNQRPKKTLDEIRATRSRSGSNVSHVSLGQKENGRQKGKGKEKEKVLDLIHEKIVEEDEEMLDASTAVIPPASGPRATQDNESLTIQEMEEAYVDLNGGAVDDQVDEPNTLDIIAMRQEEEESTQDMMMDIPQRRIDDMDIDVGWNIGPPLPDPGPAVVTHVPLDPIPEAENNAAGSSTEETGKAPEIPKIVIQEPNQSETPLEENSNIRNMRTTRSRSRSQTPFVANSTKNGKEKAKAASKKGSKAGSSRQASLAPNDSAGQSHNELLERLNVAVALNDTRLNDITRLGSELASEKLKTSEIQAKAEIDHQAMQEAMNMINTEFAAEKEALEHTIKDSDAKYTELLAEKTEWEAERARLAAELEAVRQGKISAEKDRDFFREQYGQASGYVTSVRDENKELEKRVKIAEEQTTTGVAMVKSTFELRVKALENDARSWKRMAEFAIEKDRRSDNDELRRRAGEQPELLARCSRQNAELDAFEDRVEELETQLEQKENDWMASREEVHKWKNELTQVHIALTEATTKLDRLGRAGGGGYSVDPNGNNGNEFVYCCQWRISHENGVESRACHEVFPTMSGFEEHIVNEHLGA